MSLTRVLFAVFGLTALAPYGPLAQNQPQQPRLQPAGAGQNGG